MNKDSLYAFYGSLRRGMSNHALFQHSLAFQFKEIVRGFRMHALESYPYVVHTGNAEDEIVVEVFHVTNPSTEKEIHEFELEVGYEYEEVTIRGKSVGLYTIKKAGLEPLVKSGDWVKFFGSR